MKFNQPADIEVGACCQLVNQSVLARQAAQWDPAKWEFVGDKEAKGWRDYARRKGYEMPAA